MMKSNIKKECLTMICPDSRTDTGWEGRRKPSSWRKADSVFDQTTSTFLSSASEHPSRLSSSGTYPRNHICVIRQVCYQ